MPTYSPSQRVNSFDAADTPQQLRQVSVVMPIRNEANTISRCLEAVLNQDYPHSDMEVFVIDGMSTDNTRDIIASVASRYPDVSVTILDNPRQIVAPGLNAALDQVNGDIIVRIDGHCEIDPDYISRCVAYLQTGDIDGVGGPIQTIGKTPLSETIALGMSSKFGVGGSAFRTVTDKAMIVDTVAFPAYTRRIVEQAGKFDEELVRNQDDEYNYRIRALGGTIFLAPDIHSRYHSRGTLPSLWRQYFQYGYWKVRVMQKHPRQMSLRQFVPPTFVGVLLVSGLLSPFNRTMRRLGFGVALLYAAANLGASIWTANKHGRQHLARLPAVFAALHVSYGLGFLVGLARFANRWRERR